MRTFSHPARKLTLLSALAGGYVLGGNVGRGRYQQIVEAANKVKVDPRVDDVVSRAESVVRDAAGGVSGADDSSDKVVHSAGPDIVETVDNHRAHDDSERN